MGVGLEYLGNLMGWVTEKMPLLVIDGREEKVDQRYIRDPELRKMKILSSGEECLGPDTNCRCNLAALAFVSFACNEGTFHDCFQLGRSGPTVQPY